MARRDQSTLNNAFCVPFMCHLCAAQPGKRLRAFELPDLTCQPGKLVSEEKSMTEDHSGGQRTGMVLIMHSRQKRRNRVFRNTNWGLQTLPEEEPWTLNSGLYNKSAFKNRKIP